MESYGPALLRVTVGLVVFAHGMQKLFGVWGGAGLSGTAANFELIGLAPAYPLAVTVAVTQAAGGSLLIAGALTRYVSVALAIIMMGAIWKVRLGHGFFINWALTPGQGHGMEFNILMIGALLSLTLMGPGAFSIDHRRARSAEADAAGRARLRGKL